MKIQQNGRSMVEMLGVLAIIGVLSAGALAGYSKAMFRHRVNQTIEIFQGVLQRFAELEQKGLGENVGIGDSGDDPANDIVKYGFLPNRQRVEDDGYWGGSACKLPLGIFSMAVFDDGAKLTASFLVILNDLNSCIAFAGAGWDNTVQADWFNSKGAIGLNQKIIYDPSGSEGKVISKIKMSDVSDACQEKDNNQYIFFMNIRR